LRSFGKKRTRAKIKSETYQVIDREGELIVPLKIEIILISGRELILQCSKTTGTILQVEK
jgi:hypothetical protein